jgi:hypothetical protein
MQIAGTYHRPLEHTAIVLKFARDGPMSGVIERVGVHVWMNVALALAWRFCCTFGTSRGDKQMTIDRWLMIAVDVLLPLWIVMRIIMLPVMLNSPGNSRSLTTYMQYWAEHRAKPRRHK